MTTTANPHNGTTICPCGCKYWTDNGRCVDCNDTPPVTDITITEDGVTFTQATGGTYDRLSAQNLAARYAAHTDNQPNPPHVLWLTDTDAWGTTFWWGYDQRGHLVATINTTDRGRYTATYHHRQVTARNGTTTLNGAMLVVEANAQAHR